MSDIAHGEVGWEGGTGSWSFAPSAPALSRFSSGQDSVPVPAPKGTFHLVLGARSRVGKSL